MRLPSFAYESVLVSSYLRLFRVCVSHVVAFVLHDVVVCHIAQFVFAWQERNYIRVVDLSWNGLGDPGAKEIGVYLAKNPEVTTLDISSNNFSAEGAISIAKGLKENTGLVTLRVGPKSPTYSPPKNPHNANL